jgi:putative tryptophan/tyrosine transport system substrate-binding protein
MLITDSLAASPLGVKMKRGKVISLIGGLAIAWPLATYAQLPKHPLKRIGILTSFVSCPLQPDNLVVRRLGELGWIEGQNFVFDCISTIGRIDQVPTLARELVSRHPDVLTAGYWSFVGSVKQETTTIPIVMLPHGSQYGWV